MNHKQLEQFMNVDFISKSQEINDYNASLADPQMDLVTNTQKLTTIIDEPNFKTIKTNFYANDVVKPKQITAECRICNCKPDDECGDDCLNRIVFIECNVETCPCGNRCQNTKIQRNIGAPVECFMTAHKGWVVKSNFPIKSGTFISEHVGEVVTENEYKTRMTTLYSDDIHNYGLYLGCGLVIDSHRMGNVCRFVNHSCESNCEIQKWTVNGIPRMALFAMQDIQPGEELTINYNYSLYNPAEGQSCACGSINCRGVIGSKSQQSNSNKRMLVCSYIHI